MDGGAWKAAVHGVAEGWTRLSNVTFTFHFHAWEKEMATHSSVLAWRIPGTGEPGGLPSMESHRVGHDWSDLAAAADCSPPGSYVRGILQAKIMEWVAIPFSRSSSWPKDQIRISCIAGLFFIVRTTREAHHFLQKKKNTKLFSKYWIPTSKLDQIHGVGWALEVTCWNRCNFTINNIRHGVILEISDISG